LVHILIFTAEAVSRRVCSEAESHKLNKNAVKMDQYAEATTGAHTLNACFFAPITGSAKNICEDVTLRTLQNKLSWRI